MMKMTEQEEINETEMLDQVLEEDVENLFSALYNPTRIKIIYLQKQQSLTVTQICNKLDASQSAVSYQLRELKFTRLVQNQKHVRKMILHLDDFQVYNIFDVAIAHVKEIYNYE